MDKLTGLLPEPARSTEGVVVLDRVPCSVCQHEIPLSEAVVAEATDYLMYFCGLDCYARWRSLLQA
jgi:Domain of unknown function (DUF3330)